MTASLRVKNDKYYVVLTHTTDGKKNQTWVSTGLTVTGNEGKARQLMLDMLGEKPEQAAPHDILFSDAVRRWLEDVRHRVDEVTYQGYEVQARAHILPYFDELQIRLCDVDGETLQTYINVKAKFGRSDGHGGLSAVSLRQHKNVLNQTLKLAQRDGLIQTNPADLVVMPHAAQFTGTFYTKAQMRDLLASLPYHLCHRAVWSAPQRVTGAEMGQHQLCDANADHTAHRGSGHEGRGEEQDQERIQLPQLSPDRRCGMAVQNSVTAGAILPQPLRQGLHRQRLRVYLGGRAPLLPRLCESHLPQAAEEVRPAPYPVSRPAPHLRQHAAVGGLRSEGRAGVARPLGHQDDRKHLRPSGHTPQAFHCQRFGASTAAIEAVKNKKTPNPFGFDAPADLDSHLWSEWRESNLRPLEPHTNALQNHWIYVGILYDFCFIRSAVGSFPLFF